MTSTTNPAAAILELCDRAEALAGKATPGPWETGRTVNSAFSPWGLWGWINGARQSLLVNNVHGDANVGVYTDAEFIAASPTLIPQLSAALRETVTALEYMMMSADTSDDDYGAAWQALTAAVRHIEGGGE